MKIAINTRDITVDQFNQLKAGANAIAESVTTWEDQILVNMIWDNQIRKFADLGIMAWVTISGTEREQYLATNEADAADQPQAGE